ncbi:MAG TPA: hypothetical protein VIJ14_05465, partial [Rhabdochlamydiaceae bacterium]
MTIDTTAPVEVKTNNESANIAEMRRLIGDEKKRALALEEKVAQLEAEKHQKFKASLPYKDDDADDDSEPYVDHKKLNKKLAAFEQNFEKKVDAKAETIARSMIEQERQSSFLKANPDFQQILSPEMIQKFAEKHPDIAEPMLDMPDNFSRQKLLYQNIKALGINRPAVAEPNIQQKIDANRKSPYYQPTGGNAPPYAGQGDFSQAGQKNAYA